MKKIEFPTLDHKALLVATIRQSPHDRGYTMGEVQTGYSALNVLTKDENELVIEIEDAQHQFIQQRLREASWRAIDPIVLDVLKCLDVL